MSQLNRFEKLIVSRVLGDILNEELKKKRQEGKISQAINTLRRSSKKTDEIAFSKLEKFLESKEGQSILKSIMSIASIERMGKSVPRKKSSREFMRNTIKKGLEESASDILDKLKSLTIIIEEPPRVERPTEREAVEVPESKKGVNFLESEEAKEAVSRLSDIANLPGNAIRAIRRMLVGELSVDSLLKMKGTKRTLIRNVASGLGIIGMTAGFSRQQKQLSGNLGRTLGLAVLAGTSDLLKESKEDFDSSGNVKDNRARAKLKEKPKKEDDPFRKASPKEAKDIGREVIDKLEKVEPEEAKEIKDASGLDVKQAVNIVRAELSQVEQTGRLSGLSERFFKMLKPLRKLPAQAIAVALGSLPVVGEVKAEIKAEVPPSIPRPDDKPKTRPTPVRPEAAPSPARRPEVKQPEVKREIPPPIPRPDDKVKTRPQPAPVPPPEEEVEDEDATAPSRIRLPAPKVFQPKQIVVDQSQEQENQKAPQQARPDAIIPATKVLDPYKDEKDQKADFEIDAAFDFDIPFAMNGVILENNALMQQHLMEQEIVYRNAGIDRGNNDWNIPEEVGFEKEGNPDAVPSLKFEEEYQDKPVNPNNTLKQNIMYNPMTEVLPRDGQDESLRKSVLFGEQPTF